MSRNEPLQTVQETQGGLVRERFVAPTNTLLKVASRSRPAAIAGAVAGVIRGGSTATIQAVGAGAVNQAVKAIAIAHSYLRDDGIAITCMPSFLEVSIDDQERTAICLLIERRPC
jgi:stage V sporulation protein S